MLESAPALPCSRIKLFAAADKRVGIKCGKQHHPFILGGNRGQCPSWKGGKTQLTPAKHGGSLGWKCRAPGGAKGPLLDAGGSRALSI